MCEKNQFKVYDNGEPIYLDGLRCQFSVDDANSNAIAYVYEKEIADRIAQALNSSLLLEKTLADVKAGIPARDAEIETLRKENEDLREQLEAIGAGGVSGKLMTGANADRETLMRSIVQAGQRAGIIRADLESASVSECLHILECLGQPTAPVSAKIDVTPEMLRAAQLRSELGAFACANWSGGYSAIEELFRVMVAAAPVRAEPVTIPEGWKLVPVQPTEEMLVNVDEEVGGSCHSCSAWRASEDDCKRVWAAMIEASPIAPVAAHAQPKLTVDVLSFPESNGKKNWTALLRRAEKWDGLVGNCGGITIAHGERRNRVEYAAERTRFLLGLRDTEPFILDYADAPQRADDAQAQQPVSGAEGLIALEGRLLEVAETVMQKWQGQDRIPPMAWDFRGFLVDGMRAALAQQDADKVDAERWRAYRSSVAADDAGFLQRALDAFEAMGIEDGKVPSKDQIDAAIDAARKEQE